jgi:predicted HTH domain antitoxin
MIDVEDRIDILREKGNFSSREAFLDEALQSFLREHPELRVELAVEQFKVGTISINRAAEIAGRSPEEFKRVLADRGVNRDPGFLSEDDRSDRLNTL